MWGGRIKALLFEKGKGMEELKSTTIVPITFYCYILAVLYFFLAVNAILSNITNLPNMDMAFWFFVALAIIAAIGLVFVGIGFLKIKPLCWNILFFGLAIFISVGAVFILANFMLLWVGIDVVASFFNLNQITPVAWFSILGVFLSSIIVLYYLSRAEVRKHFGDVGPRISPF